MLAQVLAASTYPLEIIQLQQWLQQHKDLKDKALVDAVKKQDWDPSVQAMAPLPDLLKQLAENIMWTTDLGNAFLAQQGDVMDAVQRMRAKAKRTDSSRGSRVLDAMTNMPPSPGRRQVAVADAELDRDVAVVVLPVDVRRPGLVRHVEGRGAGPPFPRYRHHRR